MKNRIISYLSYGTLILGAMIGGYALINIYILGRNLPSGVCPVTNNRAFIYSAIALCCVSLVLSFFEPRKEEMK
ncbi:MAG: hypothetical protein N2484_07575 [Clostridia bacterium]|nr:hypothetical protein [Clostridia bacterium]